MSRLFVIISAISYLVVYLLHLFWNCM